LKEELVILRDKLADYTQDREELLGLGLRSLAVVALVVIIGNLMYPDAVYAKSGHARGYDNFAGGGTSYPYGYNNRVIKNQNTSNLTRNRQPKPPAHAIIDNVSPGAGNTPQPGQ
jgi:hypothetical protein